MIETDAMKVYNHFQELTHKELGKALKSGLRKALRQVQKAVKTNLKSKVKNTNKKNPKFNDTLESGVRLTRVYENQDGTIVGKVRIDSNNKTGSGSYRLAILESGTYKTPERYAKTRNGKPLKKPAYRGSLEGKKFFKTAVDSIESSFNGTMVNEVNNAINKINNG